MAITPDLGWVGTPFGNKVSSPRGGWRPTEYSLRRNLLSRAARRPLRARLVPPLRSRPRKLLRVHTARWASPRALRRVVVDGSMQPHVVPSVNSHQAEGRATASALANSLQPSCQLRRVYVVKRVLHQLFKRWWIVHTQASQKSGGVHCGIHEHVLNAGNARASD